MVQKSTSIYPALRDKLKPSLLPLSDITRALSGLSPDVAERIDEITKALQLL